VWFEVYLGGRWFTFDPRNNVPRIRRILMARGRDAADVNTHARAFQRHIDSVGRPVTPSSLSDQLSGNTPQPCHYANPHN
jgi:transglutaminase-like putative cysteine protease